MPGRAVRAVVVGAVAMLSVLALPVSSWAGGPGKWTSLATVDNGFDTFGVLRTGDGKLHLAWLAKKAGNGTYSYGTGTMSLDGQSPGPRHGVLGLVLPGTRPPAGEERDRAEPDL
jgi:hypothetical protein